MSAFPPSSASSGIGEKPAWDLSTGDQAAAVTPAPGRRSPTSACHGLEEVMEQPTPGTGTVPRLSEIVSNKPRKNSRGAGF